MLHFYPTGAVYFEPIYSKYLSVIKLIYINRHRGSSDQLIFSVGMQIWLGNLIKRFR